MHDRAVYLKEGILFARDVSLENSEISFLRFQLALLQSVPYLLLSYRSLCSFLCTVFGVISSNINRVLSINSSPKVFFFGDFNLHHKDWLNYSGGIDRPDEYFHNFCVSNDLTRIVNFCTLILECDSHSLAHLFALECLPFLWESLKSCYLILLIIVVKELLKLPNLLMLLKQKILYFPKK